MTRSMVHRMLSNPYYTGRVVYGGVEYDGKHPALIDDETFWCVQALLASRRIAGDRAWKRQQYLKGTLYCARCDERMGYGHSTGVGGEYAYFFCLGRHTKRTSCDLPYLPAGDTEAAITEQWQHVHFQPTLVEAVGAVLDEEFDRRMAGDQRMLKEQRRRVVELERRKPKLLDGYLADAIAAEDLKPRQEAIRRELAEARRLIAAAEVKHDEARTRLNLGLQLLGRANELYERCDESQRATLNQVAFERLYLDRTDDGQIHVSEAVLNPEFAALISMALATGWQPASSSATEEQPEARWRPRFFTEPRRYERALADSWRRREDPEQVEADAGGNARPELTEATVSGDLWSSNLTRLAERVGFEPTDGLPRHLLSREARSA